MTNVKHFSRRGFSLRKFKVPSWERFKCRYVIAEHHCTLPADGRKWIAVSAASMAEGHREIYQCPECEACFAPVTGQSRTEDQ